MMLCNLSTITDIYVKTGSHADAGVGKKRLVLMSVTGMLKTMIPISRFNKGEANKIFDEVETTGTKIVVKNNKPACVLISPAQYESLMEMLSDYVLREEAETRMEHYDSSENRTQEQMLREFGITQSELDAMDVELE